MCDVWEGESEKFKVLLPGASALAGGVSEGAESEDRMNKIPLMIVGDGPQETSGLGRIARDLSAHILQSNLPVDLVQIGGMVPPVWLGWRHFPLDPSNEDWGAKQVESYWRDIFQDTPGILFVIWDPGRLYPYLSIDLPVQRWAYTAIDGKNRHGSLGGPAREAIGRFDRILAYGRWASEIVKTIRGATEYLPHGIVSSTYTQDPHPEFVQKVLGPYRKHGDLLIGGVMTNQPRKDLATFFGTIAELKQRGRKVYGWLHTDILVKAWAIQQLVEDFDLAKSITITGVNYPFSDTQLAQMYQACDLTLLTSLGEGFGYPIVESLAAGTPVISGDCAQGAELIPKNEWRVPSRASRIDGIYAIERPVFKIEDFANAAERALNWRDQIGKVISQAYCRGSVAALDWSHLWGRWQGWIRQGL